MTLRHSLASIRRHLTFANAMASIAVFIALGGGAYAAVQVNGKNIKPRSIAGKKLKNNTLGGKQINEGKLGTVPKAKQAQSAPSYRRSLRELQRALGGVPLEHLFAIFDGEVAAYARPGTPFPEVTVLVAVDSDEPAEEKAFLNVDNSDEPAEEKAFLNVDTVMKVLAQFRGGKPCHAPRLEDGVTVACIAFDKIEVRYAGFDEKVVVTTGQSPVTELRAGGTKLPDAESFEQAQAAADMPEKTAGFLWVDIAKAVPMIVGLAQAAEDPIPAEVRANLAPLKSLVLWGDAEGRTTSYSTFVGID